MRQKIQSARLSNRIIVPTSLMMFAVMAVVAGVLIQKRGIIARLSLEQRMSSFLSFVAHSSAPLIGSLAAMSGIVAKEIAKKLSESQSDVQRIIGISTSNMKSLIDRATLAVAKGAKHADGMQNITAALSDLDNTIHAQVTIANELSETSELMIKRALAAFELVIELEWLARGKMASIPEIRNSVKSGLECEVAP